MKAKPFNLKYTDLCIYIDKTVYERDEHNNPIALRKMSYIEEENVYNYLCNIIIALTSKKKLLTNSQDLNTFSQEFASEIFMRLRDSRQVFGENISQEKAKRGSKELLPIKSVLNYIKGTLNFSVMDYRKSTFKQIVNPEFEGQEKTDIVQEYLEESVRSSYQKSRDELYTEYFTRFPYYLDKELDNSMYKRNNIDRINLRCSILLTLHNFLTLPYKYHNSTKLRKQKEKQALVYFWKDNVVLWKNEGVITKELVILYLQKVFRRIVADIEQEEHDNYLPEDVVKEILTTSFPTYGTRQNKEE